LPCDQIRTVGITLEAPDPEIFKVGLSAMKYTLGPVNQWNKVATIEDEEGYPVAEYNTQTYKTSVRLNTYSSTPENEQRDAITAKLKQAYGVGIVKTQAKKYGWELKQVGPAKFEVLKQRR
jgi:hypothetical protein